MSASSKPVTASPNRTVIWNGESLVRGPEGLDRVVETVEPLNWRVTVFDTALPFVAASSATSGGTVTET